MEINGVNLKDWLFGKYETKTVDTPRGYKSVTEEIQPNILQRVINKISKKAGIADTAATPQSQYSPKPQVTPNLERVLNFAPHQTAKTRKIWEPPLEDKNLMFEYFPKEATSSAVAAFNESMYNPLAENINTNGTVDRGYFQINEATFNELMQKYPNTLRKMGVSSFDDMFDKRKNFAVAALLRSKLEDRAGKQPWTSWYGWQDQGFKDVGNPNIDYQSN
jgi:hypothetical protein